MTARKRTSRRVFGEKGIYTGNGKSARRLAKLMRRMGHKL